MLSEQSQSDTHWQAFLYAHGEMTPQEAAAFEERLAGDATLCQLVADEFLLCETIRAAEQVSTPVVATRDASNRRNAYQIVGTATLAAALLLTFGLQFWPAPSGDYVQPAFVAETEETAPEVLVAWSELHASPIESDQQAISDSDIREADFEFSSETLGEVPNWMLIAAESSTLEVMEEMVPGTGGTL
ncbi:MAG: hypothetical protein KDA88_00300 [Planctomycetaceae bacterium]|nr:hypothetical protein [Planctomycetaceae bacterium]MCB9950295.1 hypothetical protein [Planctomycetaceae bacterium]